MKASLQNLKSGAGTNIELRRQPCFASREGLALLNAATAA